MVVTVLEWDEKYIAKLVTLESLDLTNKVRIVSTKTVYDDEVVAPPYNDMAFYIPKEGKDISIKGFLNSKGYHLDRATNVWVCRCITKSIPLKRKRKR